MSALSHILQNPRTSLLGGVPGGVLIEDNLPRVIQNTEDVGAWVRLGVGLLSLIAGLFFRDPPPAPVRIGNAGRAELRALLIAFAVLFLALAAAAPGANIMTYAVNVTNTPVVVGQAQGRKYLELAAKTAAPGLISCGPSDLPSSSWWPLAPGGASKTFGSVVDGQMTAEHSISCVAPNGTPHPLAVAEEGKMRDLTPTPTNTP